MAQGNRIVPLLPVWPVAPLKGFEHKPEQVSETRLQQKKRGCKTKDGKGSGSRLDTWA